MILLLLRMLLILLLLLMLLRDMVCPNKVAVAVVVFTCGDNAWTTGTLPCVQVCGVAREQHGYRCHVQLWLRDAHLLGWRQHSGDGSLGHGDSAMVSVAVVSLFCFTVSFWSFSPPNDHETNVMMKRSARANLQQSIVMVAPASRRIRGKYLLSFKYVAALCHGRRRTIAVEATDH